MSWTKKDKSNHDNNANSPPVPPLQKTHQQDTQQGSSPFAALNPTETQQLMMGSTSDTESEARVVSPNASTDQAELGNCLNDLFHQGNAVTGKVTQSMLKARINKSVTHVIFPKIKFPDINQKNSDMVRQLVRNCLGLKDEADFQMKWNGSNGIKRQVYEKMRMERSYVVSRFTQRYHGKLFRPCLGSREPNSHHVNPSPVPNSSQMTQIISRTICPMTQATTPAGSIGTMSARGSTS